MDGVSLEALNYTTFVPYNESIPTGGNSLVQDLNVHYNVGSVYSSNGRYWLTTYIQAGDIAWMLTSTALVLLMIPGVG